MPLSNIFLVVPQILVATVMGLVIRTFLPGEPLWTMAFSSAVMALAGTSMLPIPAGTEAK